MLSPWGDVYCLRKGLRVQPKRYSNVEDQPENCILALKPLDLPTQRGSARSNLPATLSFPPERLRRCAVKPCQLSAVSGVDLPGELKRQEPPLWCSHLFEDICSCSVSNLTRQWPDDCSFPAGCHLSNSVRELFAEINVLFHIPVPTRPLGAEGKVLIAVEKERLPRICWFFVSRTLQVTTLQRWLTPSQLTWGQHQGLPQKQRVSILILTKFLLW